jgi:uncharacterized protein (TIGR00730 family)
MTADLRNTFVDRSLGPLTGGSASPISVTGVQPSIRPLVDQLVDELVTVSGLERQRRVIDQLIGEAAAMVCDAPEALNLKIAAAAIEEMREAFEMFQPYLGVPKVTIFGSARTQPDDPLYRHARSVAKVLAEQGWMIITGAGPGIMQAGMEGAGRDRSIGVSIRLPFEQSANPVIAGDEKYVSMKYFFTRKLMLIKESQGFVCLPGGFGTLDETFELLTLTQTGKGVPVPIVFLDTPGDPYWEAVAAFIDTQLVQRGLISAHDTSLYTITDSCEQAAAEVTRFYRNYDSLRFVGNRMVLRMRVGPSEEQLVGLNTRYGHLCASGGIERTGPHGVEQREGDKLDLARLDLHFANRGFGDLRRLIDELNTCL